MTSREVTQIRSKEKEMASVALNELKIFFSWHVRGLNEMDERTRTRSLLKEQKAYIVLPRI